jgi:hypothetical protein
VYMHNNATAAAAYPRGMAFPPSIPSCTPKIYAVATRERISTALPTMRERRP